MSESACHSAHSSLYMFRKTIREQTSTVEAPSQNLPLITIPGGCFPSPTSKCAGASLRFTPSTVKHSRERETRNPACFTQAVYKPFSYRPLALLAPPHALFLTKGDYITREICAGVCVEARQKPEGVYYVALSGSGCIYRTETTRG